MIKIKHTYINILLSIVIITLSSCTQIQKLKKSSEDGVIAAIGDEKLYYSDIDKLLPNNITKEDSIKFVESYIKQWATDILIYQKAEENILNKKEINELVAAYKKNLIIYYYKQNMVNTHVQSPTDAEIRNYYEENKEHFLLSSPAIKGIIITMPKEVPKYNKLKNKLTDKDIDIEYIEKYAIRYAYSYQIFLNNWILKENISELENTNIHLDHKGLYQVTDSNTITLLQVTDLTEKGLISPYEIAKEKARNMLLHSKQVNYINSIGENIFNYAIKHNQLIIYTNKEDNEQENLSDSTKYHNN